MMPHSPLFWLLEVEAYDFDVGVFKGTDLKGKALIISSQLWSILRGDSVISVLIGPGIFKGVAQSGNRRIDVLEHISTLMFDPTNLRYDEPVPLVDIVSPEVIDPLASRKQEEIVTVISNLVIEKGNVLAVNPVAKVKTDAAVPQMAHYADMVKRINVSHVSGINRARFILAGTNSPLYRPMVKWFNKLKYSNPEQLKVMATPFCKFADYSDIEIMSDWMIVEKAGLGGTGSMAISQEYDSVLSVIKKNESSFIYEL
ncbi:MAG: hypothetical protein ACW97A_03770 [Candidatus Thorarchaeota archaeon]|jgi:hypothetical protein